MNTLGSDQLHYDVRMPNGLTTTIMSDYYFFNKRAIALVRIYAF